MLMPFTVRNAKEIINESKKQNAVIAHQADSVSKVGIVKRVEPDLNWMSVIEKNPEKLLHASERATHNTPKVFFFLVPFFALLLKLVFLKRKNLYFVDHAIFSLHFHSLGFIVFLFSVITNALPGASYYTVLSSLLIQVVFYVYAVLSMEKVYGISTGRAMWYTFLTGVLYLLVYITVIIIMMVYYLKDENLVY
jgi:hypothetical protein